MQVNIMAIA